MDNMKAATTVILLAGKLVKPMDKHWAVMLVVLMIERMVYGLVDWMADKLVSKLVQ
jgi:hypothetical protein